MTQTQLEQAAQMDISYFLLAYKVCPTCGRKFDDMHPVENLYPHWVGACKPEATELRGGKGNEWEAQLLLSSSSDSTSHK